MKKTFYVLTCALCTLLVLPAAAQVPAYVPTDGLVGWWPFNGNANDESGNGNDGVVNGATLTEDRFGNVNNAYNFQSANSNYISINNNPVQNGTASISGWFNPTAPIGGPIIHIGSDNSTAANCNGYFFGFGTIANPTGNNLLLDASCQGNYNTEWIATPNTWYHFTLIRTQNNLTAYINGNMVGSYTPTGIISPSNNIFFGSTFSSNSVFYNGIIDDIAIYNRALTEQEIQSLYTGTTPPPCVSLPSNLQQGLVGYWPFCGNANDESGNSNDGSVNGATLTEDRFGNADAAFSFDGVDDHVIIENNAQLQGITDIAISGWININQLPDSNSVLAGIVTKWYGQYNCGNQSDNFSVWTSYLNELVAGTNQYMFYGNPQSTLVSSSEILTNQQWIHFAFNHDSEQGGELYINGNLVSENSLSGVICGSTNPLYFGCDNGVGTLNRFFNGSLDDIGIWNRALTPEEVQELYTLDACTFTVYDTSYVTVYDTLTTYETVYDTLYTYETIYDTVTTYVTVTDTLLIDITFTGFEGQPSWLNTVTVFPNPASDHITIDYGNFALMAGYNTIITDAAGATVYSSAVNSQQAYIDINAWGAAGVYYMTIYDASGTAVAVRHIVLE
jgi:hypothetical protein